MNKYTGNISVLLFLTCIWTGLTFSCRNHNSHPVFPVPSQVTLSKLDSLFDQAWELSDRDPDESEKISFGGLELAKKAGYTLGEANFLRCIGAIYVNKGKYIQAYDTLNLCLEMYEQLKAFENIPNVLNNLGNLFVNLANYEEAQNYYESILKMPSKYYSLDFTGRVYLNLGNIMVKQKKYREAFDLDFKALTIFRETKDTSRIIFIYMNIGEVYEKTGKLDDAKNYYDKSRELSETKRLPRFLMYSYYYLGNLYLLQHEYEKSLTFLIKSKVYADSLKYAQETSEISYALSRVYSGLGDFEKAFSFLSIKDSIEENLKQLETNKEITNERLKEQKEQDAVKIQLRTRLFYVSLIGFLISMLSLVLIYRNFRIKKKANRLLVEMDELKSRLFSNITHEFRTPLTLILGPLEEILSEGEKRILTRHEIKIMRKSANRLLNLVNQMLDLARLDAKSLKIELSEDDFVKFFKVNVMAFASLAEQKGLLFNWSVPVQPLVTYFDPDKLEKIVNNLISNAIKYTDKGGEVNCTLEIQSGNLNMVKFSVSDTGKGIPKDHLPRIFDRFYMVESIPGPDSFGSGIGLSLTKELITLLHGEIRAESEWGRGSRFTVILPLGLKHLKAEEYIISEGHRNEKMKSRELASIQEPEDAGIGQSEMSADKELPVVLIVEDQSDLRNYLAEHMRDSFRLIESENGRKGYDEAVRNLPDLVITDLFMPEMDGLELCKKLKTDERTSHIPVIMLTARTGMEEKLEGLETGADQYLTKPFHMKELRLIVRKLIEQRMVLRKRFSSNVKLEPKDIAITSADEKFLNRALSVIDKHMGDFDFDVGILQDEMAMSRMQLFRKIKALTDQTPGDFIRTIRLKRAASLIEQGFGNVAQVTFEAGFNNPSYFARCFREMYGVLPSEYAKNKKLKKNPEKT